MVVGSIPTGPTSPGASLEMMPRVVDNRSWLKTRLQTLRAARDEESTPEQREAIELEIARLEAELARHRRWWMLWGSRPR